ncbi:RagB/SusD family nutrient uptake outer membrane protein [Longitalea luteola]|uniref:RagB/SusD family nutrient uptake outer membrane protein n=1 Tax=Longitalea luteola TaxID=2812563 RepID=UPI001A96790E|nr:RagB/SusD family nutrient uptake outer membrane protein [Longitalea luteola]
MNNKPTNRSTILPLVLLLLSITCTKQSELERIPDSSLDLLNSLEDAQALLDNMIVMAETPALPEISADNFYIVDTNRFYPAERNAYFWRREIFPDNLPVDDWNQPYKQVYYANSVLDALPDLPTDKPQLTSHLRGRALFIRSYAFFNVALQFANLYDGNNAADPGIPLRLTGDPFEPIYRATLGGTYEQITKDLKEAAHSLPALPDPLRKNRPSRTAAYALLARVYLSMRDYTNALVYADSSLLLYAKLLDYNSSDTTVVNPFTANNEEVLYQSNLYSGATMLYSGNCYIDSLLYRSYAAGDLRKVLFFSVDNAGFPISNYGYSGYIFSFSGLAVDEVLLIRAECKARLQDAAGALQDLVRLLKSRWINGAYTPPAVNTAAEVLQLVLTERRKELVFRGLRWSDIRRLNKEGAAISLQRSFGQEVYTLTPNDQRYVFPIPPEVIALNDHIEQNPR